MIVDLVVLFGIIVSLGLIAVSVMLNYRMGYRSADTDLDGRIYGAGAAFGDCLKAIAPFMASTGLRNGEVMSTASAVVVFVICACFSFASSLGFAAEHRAGKAAIATGEINSYGDLRGEKQRLEARLNFLGIQRSPEEVEGAINAILKRRVWLGGPTVGIYTQDCANDRKVSRTACEDVAALRTERARAKEFQMQSDELKAVMDRLAGRGDAAVLNTADAQLDALSKAFAMMTDAVGAEEIGLALVVLLAGFIEVGSGMGLYMVTTPWRVKEVEVMPVMTKRKLGHVDLFMLERVGPGHGLMMLQDIHRDYLAWCDRGNVSPYNEGEFAKQFTDLGKAVGLEATYRGGHVLYRNVALIGLESVKLARAS